MSEAFVVSERSSKCSKYLMLIGRHGTDENLELALFISPASL
jgi:hypothetical protein